MRIKVLYIHQGRISPFQGEIDELLKRLKSPWQVEEKGIKVSFPPSLSDQERKNKESQLLLDASTKCVRWSLDSRGKSLSSEELSNSIRRVLDSGRPLSILIGGAVGLSDEVVEASDTVLSLSKLTFTHELARLLLAEQLYRSYSIAIGNKYHK